MVNALTGVLALQGDFAEHIDLLRSCGYRALEVRSASELESCDALIIPGGESTTILKLIDRYELRELISKKIESGLPILATCAGAIVIATQTSDGQPPLGMLDISVRRNAYGTQVDSFEADIEVVGIEGGPIRGAFIRAPIIDSIGEDVEVMAKHRGDPVVVSQGSILASTFHPEITGDIRLHRYFVERVVGDA